MIKPLRKRHFQVWAVMALLLPATIITAWLFIPKQKTQPLLQSSSADALPVMLRKIETKNYSVALRGSQDTSKFQLEWVTKNPLQYPTATIYEAGKPGSSISGSKLIGRIETGGNWYFPLDSDFKYRTDRAYQFLLYDFIHQQIIDTINLKP